MATQNDLLDGFGVWHDVEPNTGCWLWMRADYTKGYGAVNFDGHTRRAHRVMYSLVCGCVPDGMFVCHKCDQPSCVNPKHLFIGTAQDNTDDMFGKDRWVMPVVKSGVGHHNAKICLESAKEIRSLYSSGVSQRKIAKKFGISQPAVRAVLVGKTWKEGS